MDGLPPPTVATPTGQTQREREMLSNTLPRRLQLSSFLSGWGWTNNFLSSSLSPSFHLPLSPLFSPCLPLPFPLVFSFSLLNLSLLLPHLSSQSHVSLSFLQFSFLYFLFSLVPPVSEFLYHLPALSLPSLHPSIPPSLSLHHLFHTTWTKPIIQPLQLLLLFPSLHHFAFFILSLSLSLSLPLSLPLWSPSRSLSPTTGVLRASNQSASERLFIFRATPAKWEGDGETERWRDGETERWREKKYKCSSEN